MRKKKKVDAETAIDMSIEMENYFGNPYTEVRIDYLDFINAWTSTNYFTTSWNAPDISDYVEQKYKFFLDYIKGDKNKSNILTEEL